jgi:hypothetical protein
MDARDVGSDTARLSLIAYPWPADNRRRPEQSLPNPNINYGEAICPQPSYHVRCLWAPQLPVICLSHVAPRALVGGQVGARMVRRERGRVCADEDVAVHVNLPDPTRRAAQFSLRDLLTLTSTMVVLTPAAVLRR